MSTEERSIITVICDTPNCPKAERFETVADAGLAGWKTGIDNGAGAAQDFCPSCWNSVMLDEKPGPVLLDRDVAGYILGFMEGILSRADDILYPDTGTHAHIRQVITWLKEAIEK